MNHMLEDFTKLSNQSIEVMKEASLKARSDHAASELARHMLLTTQKFVSLPKVQAVDAVVSEWLQAWHLVHHEWPNIATEMETLTGAFYDYCNDPSDINDQAVRSAWLGFKDTHDNDERTLEDQMSWRSGCSHGWWGEVSPAPEGYRDHDSNRPLEPFWAKGCPPECLG